jgi:hypothetical protein
VTPASILSRAVSLTKLKIRKEKEISGTCRFSLEKVNRVCKADQNRATLYTIIFRDNKVPGENRDEAKVWKASGKRFQWQTQLPVDYNG